MHGERDPIGMKDGPGPGAVGSGTACRDCRIVAEANHRIANHLALLAASVRIGSSDLAHRQAVPERVDALLVLGRIRIQIEAIARLHRSLSTGVSAGASDLGEHLHDVCAQLALILAGRMVLIEDLASGIQVSPDQALAVVQIIAEVVSNAIKYAGRPDRIGSILVRCHTADGGAIVAEVIDDGPGLGDSVDLMTGGGLGLHLIRALAKRVGGMVDFLSTADGLRFRLTLPASNAPSRASSSLDQGQGRGRRPMSI